MLSSKQRAYLRAMANSLSPVLILGKDGLTEAFLKEADLALKSHELIKIKMLETSWMTPKQAIDQVCQKLGADPVQKIGSKFVIYRENPEDKRIVLDL